MYRLLHPLPLKTCEEAVAAVAAVVHYIAILQWAFPPPYCLLDCMGARYLPQPTCCVVMTGTRRTLLPDVDPHLGVNFGIFPVCDGLVWNTPGAEGCIEY